MMNCHCNRCRLGRAAAHATNVFYKLDGFRWARGVAQVTEYMVPDARFHTVAFCLRCGGKVPWLDVTGVLPQFPAMPPG